MPDREGLFKDLADTVPGFVVLTDAAGDNVFVNSVFAQFSGLTERDLQGPCWMQVVHEDDLPKVEAAWRHAVATCQPYETEYRFRRTDGVYRWFLVRGRPRRRGDEVVGWTIVCLDIDERRRAEDRAAAAAARLDALLEFVPDGITLATAPDVTIERTSRHGLNRINRRQEEVTGISAEKHPEAWQVYDADGSRLLTPDELPLTRAVKQGEVVENEPLNLRLPDGALLPILCNAGPIRGPDGEITGGVIVWRDITERKRAERQREMLVGELNHRIKNLFGIANSIINLSARSVSTTQDLARVVSGRLNALSHAHGLVAPSRGSDATAANLADIIREVVGPHLVTDGNLTLTGPEFAVGPHGVTALALVLHEWATNAAKYGCLSTAAGRLDIGWRVDDKCLLLTWSETGGPPITQAPQHLGFGSVLSRSTVEGSLDGSLEQNWRPEGVELTLTGSLARLGA